MILIEVTKAECDFSSVKIKTKPFQSLSFLFQHLYLQ
jgi:hypothetical protein